MYLIRYQSVAFLVLMLLVLQGCKKSSSSLSPLGRYEPEFAQQYPDYDKDNFKNVLAHSLSGDSMLHKFYDGKEPVWIGDTIDIDQFNSFVAVLTDVKMHGLSSEYFNLNRIDSIGNLVISGSFTNGVDSLYKVLSELEILSTQAAIKYIKGMKYGFINPSKLYSKVDYDFRILTPDSVFYADMMQNVRKNPVAAMKNAQPLDSAYQRMVREYRRLEALKNTRFEKIKDIGTKEYKQGDKDENIAAIARRLTVTGEYIPDTLGADTIHQVLDGHLLAAINTFRRLNSYPEDKTVGSLTIAALNRPIDYYLKTLEANMERYRWQKDQVKSNMHLEVNVPAFKLIAVRPDSLPLVIDVCVGSVANKTPLLESKFSYINLNPKWNVPRSIAKNEVFVKQKKDTTYLKRQNMRLFKGDKEVDISSIDWENAKVEKLPYYVRQESGSGNSLGRIKFMFNNKFSVYLHDTPVQRAFGRKNRAISHGCVRVKYPVEMAYYLLSPTDDVYKDRLRYSIDLPPESATGKKLQKENKLAKLPNIINMKNTVSLSIDYHTVYVIPEDFSLYYADDVYVYDEVIRKALGEVS